MIWVGLLQGGRLGARLPALTVVHGEVRQTEWVALNVGGRLLQTELGTLTAVPDSHLAQLATAWQSFPHQQIFLDRSPQVGAPTRGVGQSPMLCKCGSLCLQCLWALASQCGMAAPHLQPRERRMV